MNFKETRSNQIVSFLEAVNDKKSPNNSLYVPINIPNIYDKLSQDMDYRSVLFTVLKSFITEISEDKLLEISDIKGEPIVNKNFAELYHTDTLTHHDFANQVLINFLKYKKELIQTISTGDNAISLLQVIKQPCELLISSNLTKCEKKMLKLFSDSEYSIIDRYYSDIETKKQITDTTNIIYIIVQVATMFYCYLQLIKQKQIVEDQKINVALSIGTFSNAISCYYAKKAGLPINVIICGENLNRPVYNMFRSNKLFRQLNCQLTNTPQLDILYPRNIERLIFEIFEQDFDKTRNAMDSFESNNETPISIMGNPVAKNFYINYANNIEVSKQIYSEFSKNSKLINPITAIAMISYNKFVRESNDNSYTLILETSSPYKDYHEVCQSLGVDTEDSTDIQILYTLENITKMEVPQQIIDICQIKIN